MRFASKFFYTQTIIIHTIFTNYINKSLLLTSNKWIWLIYWRKFKFWYQNLLSSLYCSINTVSFLFHFVSHDYRIDTIDESLLKQVLFSTIHLAYTSMIYSIIKKSYPGTLCDIV